jgi:Leucine-rich repeat (LRR) protein/PKD repeat protein
MNKLKFGLFFITLLVFNIHNSHAQSEIDVLDLLQTQYGYDIEDLRSNRNLIDSIKPILKQRYDSIQNARREDWKKQYTEENTEVGIKQMSAFSAPMAMTASAADLETERQALITIYNELSGFMWNDTDGWKINGSFSPVVTNDWYGITVNDEGHVIKIELGSNNVGNYFTLPNIPDVFDDLPYLEVVDFGGNYENLSGPFPNSFYNLEYLEVLDLSTVDYDEEVLDFGLFKNLHDLKYLDITYCNATIHLDFKGNNLNQLEVLVLTGNTVGPIPSEISNMTNLVTLDLSSITNQFCSFPPSFQNLPVLKNLYMDYMFDLNMDIYDPESYNCFNLNSLTFLPLSLEYLDMESSTINGSFPSDLSHLTNLRHLSAPYNAISDVAGVGTISNLETINFAYNELSGSIPQSFSNLIELQSLNLHFNDLNEEIPTASWENLNKLSSIDLSYNLIPGTIPASLGVITSLTYIDFSVNNLEGPIPAGFAEADFIDLRRNHYSCGNILNIQKLILNPGDPFLRFNPQNKIVIDETKSFIESNEMNLEALIDRGTDPKTKYQWFKYVDGTNDIALNPELDTANHTFTKTFALSDTGMYYYKIYNDSVKVIQQAYNGTSYDYTWQYNFYQQVEGIHVKGCQKLAFDFTFEPFICTTLFNLVDSSDHTCDLISYNWDFGDGGTSDEKNLYHSFNTPGTYDITLIVEYQCAAECGPMADTINRQIEIPEVDFEIVETQVSVLSNQISNVLSASASTFTDTWPIKLNSQNLQNIHPYQSGSMGVWRNNSAFVYDTLRIASELVDVSKDGTYTLNTFNWQYAGLEAVPNWLKVNEITNYTQFSFESENRDILGNYTSAIYGYAGQLPVATGQNMRLEEMAFTGFEDIDDNSSGNWKLVDDILSGWKVYPVETALGQLAVVKTTPANLSSENIWWVFALTSDHKMNILKTEIVCLQPHEQNPEWSVVIFDQPALSTPWSGSVFKYYGNPTLERPDIDSNVAHSGKSSLIVSSEITREQDQLNLNPGKEYLISCWVSVNDLHLTEPVLADNIGLGVIIKDQFDAVVTTYDFTPEGPIIEGWQKLTGTFSYPVSANSFELTFKPGSKGTAWYDDLRLHPLEGNMQAYVYEPETFRLKAVLDENNYASLYYYDKEGKLRVVKKETEKGIKTISESVNHLVEYEQ